MPGRPYVILSYFGERNLSSWYVTRPDRVGRMRRSIPAAVDLNDPFVFLGATGRARTCQVGALVDDHSRFFSRG